MHVRIERGPDPDSGRKFQGRPAGTHTGHAWHWVLYDNNGDWMGFGCQWYADRDAAWAAARAIFGDRFPVS